MDSTSAREIIIDCDPGIDDALALLLAAGSPELDLLGVTCVAGNRPVHTTARNASRLLALAGRNDVAVHAGCSRPIGRKQPRCNLVHGEDGLGGVWIEADVPPMPRHAVDFLEQHLVSADAGTVSLVAMGPLTNLALAELKSPGLLKRAGEVLVMGGAAFVPGNITPRAEFNFYADPVAAQVVLDSGARIVLFGLDVTSQVSMPQVWIDSLGTLGNRCGQAALDMLRAYAQEDPLLHDVCPVAYALRPDLFTTRPCSVEVDWSPGPDEGHVSAWLADAGATPFPPNVELALSAQPEGLLDLVRSRIARLP